MSRTLRQHAHRTTRCALDAGAVRRACGCWSGDSIQAICVFGMSRHHDGRRPMSFVGCGAFVRIRSVR